MYNIHVHVHVCVHKTSANSAAVKLQLSWEYNMDTMLTVGKLHLHLLVGHVLIAVNADLRSHWTVNLLMRGQRLLEHVISTHLALHLRIITLCHVGLGMGTCARSIHVH